MSAAFKNPFKKAINAGAKKGKDMLRIHETGGMAFFVAHIPECQGDLGALEAATDAAVQATGGGELAMCLASNSNDTLVMSYVIPKSRAHHLGLDDWLAKTTAGFGGEIVKRTDTSLFYQAPSNTEDNLFPHKMQDTAMARGFELLRSKKLMVDDDDGDEFDIGEMYANNGIEW
jgi:hypothetical protein